MWRICIILAIFLVTKTAYGQVPTTLRRPTHAEPKTFGLEGGKPSAPRMLKPLVIAPSLGLNIDGSGTTPVPSIHAQGDRYILGDETSGTTLLLQSRFDFNTRPAAGNKDDVASRIKIAPGNANLDIGVKMSWFPSAANQAGDEGSLGVDIRLGVTAAYQTGDSSMMAGDLAHSQFGLFSGQATVAVWLWFLYIGAQGNYFLASGDSDVATAIKNTAGLTGTAIVPITSGSGATEKTYYLQFTAGGDNHAVVTAFAVTAQFTPF
jgi:hypothetical protein